MDADLLLPQGAGAAPSDESWSALVRLWGWEGGLLWSAVVAEWSGSLHGEGRVKVGVRAESG